MPKRIGFVGLGTMGGPMAGHLLAAGHDVTVWNRSPDRARPLAEVGARIAGSLEELGRECDVICLCVNRTEDVRECVGAIAKGAKPGTLIVDHSTIEPAATKAIANALKSKGLRFVDAPLTGGSVGAQRGQLTIFCGGDEADVSDAMPYLQAYAKRAERVGPTGSGQMMKMANQIAVAGSVLGLCESLAFAKKAGLELAQAKDLIGGGAAGSWAFDTYGPKILAGDWTPGFSIKNQRKDLAYCLKSALEVDAALPGAALVDRLLKTLEDRGDGEKATTALFQAYLEMGA